MSLVQGSPLWAVGGVRSRKSERQDHLLLWKAATGFWWKERGDTQGHSRGPDVGPKYSLGVGVEWAQRGSE